MQKSICIFQNKITAVKVTAGYISKKMREMLKTNEEIDEIDTYSIIAVSYAPDEDIFTILMNINYTQFTEATYIRTDFLQILEADLDIKFLLIEANLSEIGGNAVTGLVKDIITQISPTLLTLVAGEQCLQSMKEYQSPSTCFSFDYCAHQNVRLSIDIHSKKYFTNLQNVKLPVDQKNLVSTTNIKITQHQDGFFEQQLIIHNDDQPFQAVNSICERICSQCSNYFFNFFSRCSIERPQIYPISSQCRVTPGGEECSIQGGDNNLFIKPMNI